MKGIHTPEITKKASFLFSCSEMIFLILWLKPVTLAKKRIRKKRVPRKSSKKSVSTFHFEKNFWRKHWLRSAILFLLAIGLYAMSIPYEFVLDDQIVISKNNFTKEGISGISKILTTDSFQGYFGEQKDLVVGSRYRPLSIVTFAIEYELFGLDSKVHHLVNILGYGLLALLVFRVMTLMFPEQKFGPWFFSLAFLGSILFVTHPVHSEAIANIKGRDEIMSMLASLASVYAVFRYSAKGSRVWWLLSAVFFFLGLLSKENTITFLAVIPLAYYFFSSHKLKHIANAMAPILITTVLYLILRMQVVGYLIGDPGEVKDVMNNPFLGTTTGERFATIFYTLLLYLKLLFFPHPLTHDYYPYHIPIMDFSKIVSLATVLIYVLLGFFALWKLRSKHILSFAILYFLATLSIVSNLFFPVGTFMNERFLFMPSLGFCIAAGYLLWKLYHGRHGWMKPAAIAIAAIYVLGFAFQTLRRVPVWKNAMTLNSAAIKVSKNSARANCFMATAMYNKVKEDKSLSFEEKKTMMHEADSMLDISLEMIPAYYSANQMKSGVAAEIYNMDRDLDRLLAEFRGIIEDKPNIVFINEYMEYLNGRNVDKQKLMDFYYDAGYNLLARKHRRPDYAVELLKLGLALDPNNARINYAIGKIYTDWGRTEEGTPYLTKAYTLDPSLRNQQ